MSGMSHVTCLMSGKSHVRHVRHVRHVTCLMSHVRYVTCLMSGMARSSAARQHKHPTCLGSRVGWSCEDDGGAGADGVWHHVCSSCLLMASSLLRHVCVCLLRHICCIIYHVNTATPASCATNTCTRLSCLERLARGLFQPLQCTLPDSRAHSQATGNKGHERRVATYEVL